MKKIAIINCLKANEVCAGVSCLAALDDRRAGFEVYKDEEVKLVGFARCSQCQTGPEERGMLEKLERLKSCGVETVHIGVCAQPKSIKCEYMEKNAEWLKENGIDVIWRTH